jgi:hypothetical protein
MVNDIQTKNWLLDRIEHLLDAHRMGLESNKEEFERFTNDFLSGLTNNRNSILVLVGIFVTSILSLLTIDDNDILAIFYSSLHITDKTGAENFKTYLFSVLIVALCFGALIYIYE